MLTMLARHHGMTVPALSAHLLSLDEMQRSTLLDTFLLSVGRRRIPA